MSRSVTDKKDLRFLPISINITNKKILIIGGGKVALQKIKLLKQFTDNIFVVAIDAIPEVINSEVFITVKPYDKTDLEDAFLVYACTNVKEINYLIKEDAEELGILVNVADDPLNCDFVSPAIYKRGFITVAVGSNAQDVHRIVDIRNAIKTYLENDSALFLN